MKGATGFLVASYVAAIAAMLFADFGWRPPYIIMAVWASGLFMMMAATTHIADLIVDLIRVSALAARETRMEDALTVDRDPIKEPTQ